MDSHTPVVVQLQAAGKTYHQAGVAVTALQPTTVNIEAGAFVCVSGPSGSGKSTLLNLMGAMDQPTAGEVLIGNVATSGMSPRQRALLRRDRIGFVFQAHNLISVLSAAENVEYPLILKGVQAAERRRLVANALAAVGIAELRERRPAEMSGGQRQRVAVARAIVHDPLLVLADEPTASLDSATGRALMAMLADLNRETGMTFVFSSHDPEVIGCARRRIVLRDGRIVEVTDRAGEGPA